MFRAAVIADSINGLDDRLTTIEATFPRFILAEVNTHCLLSRNSASSRAIPTERHIQRVREEMFMPETFNKRVKGMGVGDAFNESDAATARLYWEGARDDAVKWAEMLNDLGLDKSRVNRLLEPFMWHTAVISATEWRNFFALRDHPEAQPEFQIIARMMREEMEASVPLAMGDDDWHVPFIDDDEYASSRDSDLAFADVEPGWTMEKAKYVSVRRCAAISYDKHAEGEAMDDSIAKAKGLGDRGHYSPYQHVARPFSSLEHHVVHDIRGMISKHKGLDPQIAEVMIREAAMMGNYTGWVQFRKTIPNEHDFTYVREKEAATL